MNGTVGTTSNTSWYVRVGLLLASLVVGGLAATPRASAQEPRTILIADVKVVGNSRVPTPSIIANMQSRAGRELNNTTLQDDVRKLMAMGSFRDIKVHYQNTGDGQVMITLQCLEHPNLIQDVLIKNAPNLKKDDIEVLRMIRKGGPLNPGTVEKAKLEIQEYYKAKGRLFATVSIEEGFDPSHARVVMNVTEGPVVHVRKIAFEGNETLASGQRLKTQINSSQMFLGLIGGAYSPQMIDYDILKLEEYYKNNGYLDVRITRELIFNSDYRTVDVLFHIKEGVRYKVGNIVVNGAKHLSKEQVQGVIKTKLGEPFNATKAEIDERNIADLCGWRGYFVRVKHETEFKEADSGLVTVRYELADNDTRPAQVGQVQIVGNTVTKDRVIRRMLGLYPGQTFEYPQLRIAEANLRRSNLFEINQETGVAPSVQVVDADANGSFKDVIVNVAETFTGTITFGVGVSSDSGLIGNIMLNERNFDILKPPRSLADFFNGSSPFRGGGQEFRLEASPGTQLQRYSVSWREPFFLDRPMSLGVSGQYYDRAFNEYLERRIGGRVSVGHQLPWPWQDWSLTGSLRLEQVSVDSVPFYAPQDYLSAQGDHLLVGLRGSLSRDRRDNFIRPTEGNSMEFSFEQVLGDYTFPVVSAEVNQYFTTYQRPDGSGRHVLVARGQASWAGANTPVFERFFAGGTRSIRGFEYRGVGPDENGFKLGGEFMLLAGLEYQVPIKANDQLYMVAFLDSGTVERNLEIKDYRVTAGFGLRIVVPAMGPLPLAFDFGFPIVRGPNDRDQMFSFYVGVSR